VVPCIDIGAMIKRDPDSLRIHSITQSLRELKQGSQPRKSPSLQINEH